MRSTANTHGSGKKEAHGGWGEEEGARGWGRQGAGLWNLPAIGYGSLTIEGEIFPNVKNIIYNGLFPDKILAVIGGDLSSSKLYLPYVNIGADYQKYEIWKSFLRKSGEVWKEDQILYEQNI